MYYRINFQNELYHHGTKGQKWGIRRYQNKDGSLTPAGKARLKTGPRSTGTMEKAYYEHGKALANYKLTKDKYQATKTKSKGHNYSGKKQELQTAKAELKNSKKEYKQARKEAKTAASANTTAAGAKIYDTMRQKGHGRFASGLVADTVNRGIVTGAMLAVPVSSIAVGSISPAAGAAIAKYGMASVAGTMLHDINRRSKTADAEFHRGADLYNQRKQADYANAINKDKQLRLTVSDQTGPFPTKKWTSIQTMNDHTAKNVKRSYDKYNTAADKAYAKSERLHSKGRTQSANNALTKAMEYDIRANRHGVELASQGYSHLVSDRKRSRYK